MFQVDLMSGFRCLARTREQQHSFNCPCSSRLVVSWRLINFDDPQHHLNCWKYGYESGKADTFGYSYQEVLASVEDVFLHDVVSCFMFFPTETRYQLSLLPQEKDFPALLEEGKARVARWLKSWLSTPY